MSDKKTKQLGMNPSTASGRLVKDLLWSLIVETSKDSCCKCGSLMSRETFSIEHVTPWLDSDDPVGLYFDIGNISYSHLSCNRAAARSPNKKYFSAREAQDAKNKSNARNRQYCPERRKSQYMRTGK